jgi:hypothetical protein
MEGWPDRAREVCVLVIPARRELISHRRCRVRYLRCEFRTTGTGRAIFSEYSFRRGTETSATARVTQQVDQAFLKQSLKTVAYAAVWIPYMLLSKRVVANVACARTRLITKVLM